SVNKHSALSTYTHKDAQINKSSQRSRSLYTAASLFLGLAPAFRPTAPRLSLYGFRVFGAPPTRNHRHGGLHNTTRGCFQFDGRLSGHRCSRGWTRSSGLLLFPICGIADLGGRGSVEGRMQLSLQLSARLPSIGRGCP